MKKFLSILTLLAAVFAGPINLVAADPAPAAPAAPPAPPAPKPPSIEDRITDLEAYINNGARQTNAATAIATSAGPGHNAWMMTSAALVLFMTLPGLALFYGGLVRRKNVLSVLAQC